MLRFRLERCPASLPPRFVRHCSFFVRLAPDSYAYIECLSSDAPSRVFVSVSLSSAKGVPRETSAGTRLARLQSQIRDIKKGNNSGFPFISPDWRASQAIGRSEVVKFIQT